MVDVYSTKINIHQLGYLKLTFERVIDSRRTFDKINSLSDLIHIFKKRDCDLQPLYDQLNILNQIENTPEELTPSTVLEDRTYVLPNLPSDPVRNCKKRIPIPSILPDLPSDPIEKIDQLIANEIGQKWKDLARALRIPEGIIDDFNNYKSSESIREILRYHRNNTHLWKTELCTALSKARRKDLSIEVQKIFELCQMN